MVVRAAQDGARAMTAAAKEKSKAKRELTRPWVELRSAWYEAIAMQHGTTIVALEKRQAGGLGAVTWGPPERSLAKILVKDIGLEQAVKAARYYVNEWCPRNKKQPGFGLFWSVRGQLIAEMSGEIKPRALRKTKDDVLKSGEYDAQEAKKYPRIG